MFEIHGNRLFDTHKLRKTSTLNGFWRFRAKKIDYDVEVPSCWEKLPQLANYRGFASYVKTVEVAYDTDLRFFFEGVSFFAKVYFDGKFLCSHYNAYTPFYALAQDVKKGKHTLKVVVGNKFGFYSALHIENDYYSYGGITRGVQMEYVGKTYIDSVELVPEKTENGWALHIGVLPLSSDLKTVGVSCVFDNETRSLGRAECGIKTVFTLPAGDVRLWSPEEPELYEVQVILEKDGVFFDDCVERTGFRELCFKTDGFYLNGKKTFIKGVNRHEDFNVHGCSVPPKAAEKDIEIIKSLGANAVRTCHYPNSSLFLDMCDESGLLVWEETHSRGISALKMHNPHFEKQLSDCGREMVKYHIGHPSIVIWGCLNECADKSPSCRKIYERHVFELKGLDDSRPVTFASCKPFESKCLDLEDIVSYNLYYDWIKKTLPEEGYPKVWEWTQKNGGANKPIIISEFGAGAVYGRRSETGELYSEEKQASCLKNNLKFYLSRPEIIGVFVWQYCDCRVTPKCYLDRPGGINDKGIVDAYRNKKLGFYEVQKAFTDKK